MKLITKLAAGSLFTFGCIFLIVPLAVLPNQHASQDDRDAALGCLVLGLPPALWGGWLAWRLHQQAQQEQRDRLQSIFFRLIKQADGYINVLGFAMEAQLTGIAAKQYLDERAREFNATFDVDEEGGISYRFNLGKLSLHDAAAPQAIAATPSGDLFYFNPAEEKFDVILEQVPVDKQVAVIRTLRALTGLDLKRSVDLVSATPRILARGAPKDLAESFKQQLEAAGAYVSLRLP